MASGKETDRPGDGYHSELQFLFNLGAVGVLEIPIHARRFPLVIAHTNTGLEKVTQREQPFPAQRRTGEVLDVEYQLVEIADDDITGNAAIFAFRKEPAN